jgi:molecular chaperone GrpE
MTENKENLVEEISEVPEDVDATDAAATEDTEKQTKSEKKKQKKLDETVSALEAKLEAKEKEIAELNDRYMRMAAEYDNFRKRSAKEKDGIYSDAYADALKAILPIIDNLERALMFSDGEALTEGVKMTLKQFEDALSRLGVEAFGVRGEAFDPHFHNAVMQVEDPELEANTIAEVFQKGYKKGDKIIRDAMVKVAN